MFVFLLRQTTFLSQALAGVKIAKSTVSWFIFMEISLSDSETERSGIAAEFTTTVSVSTQLFLSTMVTA
jgi:hypothetical protein